HPRYFRSSSRYPRQQAPIIKPVFLRQVKDLRIFFAGSASRVNSTTPKGPVFFAADKRKVGDPVLLFAAVLERRVDSCTYAAVKGLVIHSPVLVDWKLYTTDLLESFLQALVG